MTPKNMTDALRTIGFGLYRHNGIWTAYAFHDESISASSDDLESVYYSAIKLKGRASRVA